MKAIPRENVPDRPDTGQKYFPLDFPLGQSRPKDLVFLKTYQIPSYLKDINKKRDAKVGNKQQV